MLGGAKTRGMPWDGGVKGIMLRKELRQGQRTSTPKLTTMKELIGENLKRPHGGSHKPKNRKDPLQRHLRGSGVLGEYVEIARENNQNELNRTDKPIHKGSKYQGGKSKKTKEKKK